MVEPSCGRASFRSCSSDGTDKEGLHLQANRNKQRWKANRRGKRCCLSIYVSGVWQCSASRPEEKTRERNVGSQQDGRFIETPDSAVIRLSQFINIGAYPRDYMKKILYMPKKIYNCNYSTMNMIYTQQDPKPQMTDSVEQARETMKQVGYGWVLCWTGPNWW